MLSKLAVHIGFFCNPNVALLKHLIENSSQPDEIVLDPFAGCGSTGLACKQAHRNFIGYEIDKKYYDIALRVMGINND